MRKARDMRSSKYTSDRIFALVANIVERASGLKMRKLSDLRWAAKLIGIFAYPANILATAIGLKMRNIPDLTCVTKQSGYSHIQQIEIHRILRHVANVVDTASGLKIRNKMVGIFTYVANYLVAAYSRNNYLVTGYCLARGTVERRLALLRTAVFLIIILILFVLLYVRRELLDLLQLEEVM